MFTTLIKGQKVGLTNEHPGLTNVKVGLGWDANSKSQAEFDLDAIAFLVGANGQVSSSKDVVYYNNLIQSSVSLSKDNRNGVGEGDDEEIFIQLNHVPANVEKIVIAISIYDSKNRKQTFGQVFNGVARIVNIDNKTEMYRYNIGTEFSNESSVIVGEFYRYKGTWKFGVVGIGVEDGLNGLCQHFGLNNLPLQFFEKKEPVVNTPNQTKIRLSKIELKKSGDSINLTKTSKALGEVAVNLNWNQTTNQSKGFFSSVFSSNKGIDLDLGCLYEFKDGSKSAVQPLGKNFGSYNQFPYIHLDQDDRTGASANGENLRINGNKISEFKRILIFALIYDGVPNWSEVDGVVTIKQQDGPEIVVKLDEHRNGLRYCAVAMVENMKDETFKIQKLVQYFKSAAEMDKKYRWGLRWTHASKD